MSQPYLLAFIPILEGFEGKVCKMYQDTRGNVTCGVGFELPNAMTACGFAWYLPGGVVEATVPEIRSEWQRVKAMEHGLLPEVYAIPTALVLRPEDIDAHLLIELDSLADGLAMGIEGFDALPDAWKMALTDMAFNLGLNGLLDGYPHLLADVEAGNGSGAAAQCHRIGISDARNNWAKSQFGSKLTQD